MNCLIGSRTFSLADQARFAALSGDFNPIHIDSAVARRTGAGALVVHGVHTLLWSIDCATSEMADARQVASLRVTFDAFVTVDERVEAVLVHHDEKRMRIEARVRGVLAMTAVMGFGDEPAVVPVQTPAGLIAPVAPIDQSDESILTMAGRVPFATTPALAADMFPNAGKLLGVRRVAALGAFTRLVGMVCPGLHSVFHSLSLERCNDDEVAGIGFRVTDFNLQYRRILCGVCGGGWVGTLTSSRRYPQTAQASMADVAKHVTPGEFSKSVALIVGGSRGLGEVAAKIIAAGGGKSIISYATGQSDAQRVSAEIRAWGGLCDLTKLDVNAPIAPQLTTLEFTPNVLLYFATPMIRRRTAMLFDADRLAEFVRYYVTGFYNCCRALMDRGAAPLVALYPSTTFVDDRPTGLTEYAMAKAAGEQLCRDMNLEFGSFRAFVSRLPRLATDQNPGFADSGQSVCEALIPEIRKVSGHSEVCV